VDTSSLKAIIDQANRRVNDFDALINAAIGSGGGTTSSFMSAVEQRANIVAEASVPAETEAGINSQPIPVKEPTPINPEDVEYRTLPGSDEKFAMPVGKVGDIMPHGHPHAGLVFAGLSPGPDAQKINRPLYIEIKDQGDMTPVEADHFLRSAQAERPGIRLPTAEEIKFLSQQSLSKSFQLSAGPRDAYLDDDRLLFPLSGESVFTDTGIARQRPANVPAHIRLVMT
jgi:hypothetical protein